MTLRSHGGARDGAGRPRTSPFVPHAPRERLASRFPVHVTLRMREHVWNLRSGRSFRLVKAALQGVLARPDFRVVHFSVQGNHVHLITEAADAKALARGMQALSIRLAKALNRMMDRRGTALSDRYHAHILRTPSEVRRALAYVLKNFASHALRRGEILGRAMLDPYSSAGVFDGWTDLAPVPAEVPVTPARTWLLTVGWRRHGLIPG